MTAEREFVVSHGHQMAVSTNSSEGIMARKILNRRELRKEVDASERLDAELGLPADEEEDKEEAAAAQGTQGGQAQKAPGEAQVAVQTGQGSAVEGILGRLQPDLNQVAQFEYNQSDEAKKKAADMTESKKSPHFVQLVKKGD